MTSAESTAAYVAMHHRMGTVAGRRRIPRAKFPTLVESDYAVSLVEGVSAWRRLLGPLVAQLPDLVAGADRRMRRDDLESGRRARQLIDKARITVTSSSRSRVEMIAQRAALRTAVHHKAEFVRQMQAAFGVEVPILDRGLQPMVDSFIHENTALVEKLGQRTLDDIEKLVNGAFARGMTIDDLNTEIERRFEIAERHARLIARDQIQKLNAQVTRMRHQAIGVLAFRWLTRNDSKVRPSHAVKHGRIFPYEGSRAPSFLPGDEHNCRCSEEPVFDEIRGMAGIGKGRKRIT